MKYRIRVEKVLGNGRELEVEIFAETEASADAAGRAFLKAYPESQVLKEDLTGENPPEVFIVGFPDWLKPKSAEQRAELWSAMTPLTLVEPGSVHDVVDLSRLA
jgi:hypothetical protein